MDPQNFWLFAGLAGIGTTVGLLWGYVRAGWNYISGLLIGRMTFNMNAAMMVEAYYSSQLKAHRVTPGGMTIGAGYVPVRSLKRWCSVFYQDLGRGRLFRHHSGWVYLSRSGGSGDGSQVSTTSPIQAMYLRGFFNPAAFLRDAEAHCDRDTCEGEGFSVQHRYGNVRAGMAAFNSAGSRGRDEPAVATGASRPVGSDNHNWFRTNTDYQLLCRSKSDIGAWSYSADDDLSNLALPEECHAEVKRLSHWLTHRDWFLARSIPWRRGIMVHGVPGTGKSAFARALAAYLDLPLVVLHLSTMDNIDLNEAFRPAASKKRACIMLIEDLDSLFDGRRSLCELTFDELLNKIDGVDGTDGVILIITTNHLDKIDPAIGGSQDGRPGRVNTVIEMPLLDTAGQQAIAARILQDWPDAISEVVNCAPITGAVCTERCVRKAMQLWEATV